MGTATDHACPTPPLQTYTQVGRSAEYTARASAPRTSTAFYGDGIVNAYNAVTTGGGS